MAEYQTDLRDIHFNLFELLECQKHVTEMGVDDLKSIIQEYDNFVSKEVFPCREKGDQEGVKLENKQVTVPSCFQAPKDGYYENGWFALGLSEDIGGVPVPHSLEIACHSLSTGANTSFMMYLGLSKGALKCILACASQEQKDLYVPPLMSGQFGGTMCLTEAGAGSDVGAAKTKATPKENGRYSIEGTKIFISSGDSQLFENIVHLVLARTPGAKEGTAGLSLFIVPKYKVNEDGSVGASNDVICSKVEEKMGLHGQATCELLFGSQGDCEGWLMGGEGNGMKNMFILMNEARLDTGLQGESQANLAFMLTKQYVHERSQFGKAIIEHPDVKKHMLKTRAMTRGMRALCLYTAGLFDEKAEDEIGLLTPICKAFCSDQGLEVASNMVQMHGGYGYCSEYGVEQFMRDTKIAAIYEGTNGIQAIDLVMRKVLRDQGKTLMALGGKIQASLSSGCEPFAIAALAIGEALQKTQQVLAKFANYASTGDFDSILVHCTEFLEICGYLITSWRLLESAKIAQEKLSGEIKSDDKIYYESKIIDLNMFTEFYLQKTVSLTRLILKSEGYWQKQAVL